MQILFHYLPYAIGLLYILVCEIVDTKDRLERLEKSSPRLWKLASNRPLRLALLIVAIGFLAKDSVPTPIPPPSIKYIPPAPPIELPPKIIYRDASEDKKKRAAIRTELGNLLSNARQLMTLCQYGLNVDAVCSESTLAWHTRTSQYIKDHLEPSYYSRFVSANERKNWGVDPQRSDALNQLNNRANVLEEFIKELLP